MSGNKFMPKMHLRQPGCTYSACGPFTKNKERIRNFKSTDDSRYLSQISSNHDIFIQDIFTKVNSIKPVFNMI